MVRLIFLIKLNMNYPINNFRIESIRQLLLNLSEKCFQNPSLQSILTIGLRNGNEKTGRILGFDNEMLCIQMYTEWGINTFVWTQDILYVSLWDISTLMIHEVDNPEISELLTKQSKPLTSIPKLEMRRNLIASLTKTIGSEDLEVTILWETFDVTSEFIVHRCNNFMTSIIESVSSICHDDLWRNAWKNEVKAIVIKWSDLYNVERANSILHFSFSTSISKNEIPLSELTSMIEGLI